MIMAICVGMRLVFSSQSDTRLAINLFQYLSNIKTVGRSTYSRWADIVNLLLPLTKYFNSLPVQQKINCTDPEALVS